MNAILYCNWFSRITGSVIDAFEYYIAILEHNPEFKLIFVNLYDNPIESLIKAFENRYELDDINYLDNISVMKRNDLLHIKFNKVLILDYGTINQTRGLVDAKEIIIISELYTDDPKYMYNKDLLNVTYYGEMPFVYKDVKYKMKFLFDRFKKLTKCEKGYYVNSPKNNDHSFLETLPLIKSHPIYFKAENHVENFFELFTWYIYYHANKYFDPHPRLFHECSFYGKKIMYYNPYQIFDGSFYRYADLENYGLRNRTLNKYDEIVRQFI